MGSVQENSLKNSVDFPMQNSLENTGTRFQIDELSPHEILNGKQTHKRNNSKRVIEIEQEDVNSVYFSHAPGVAALVPPMEIEHGAQREIHKSLSLREQFSVLMEKKSFAVGVYAVLLLISAVGNNIFEKKMTNMMPNYPYFLSQFVSVTFVIIFGVIVYGYTMNFTSLITKEQTNFPKWKFLVMGSLDAISMIFVLFGGVYTSGNIQALLIQSVVPLTMIFAYFIAGTRFRIFQILGAAIILGGVVTVILPKFLDPVAESGSTPDKPLFNIIFIMGMVPMALSSVFKEMAFGHIELDVNYLQLWVALFQFLIGFVLMPLNTLSFLGPNQMPWGKLPNALWDGLKCLGTVNTIVTNCGPSPQFDIPCDTCETAFVNVLVYLMFNISYNIFIVLVIKHGSASLLFIIMTVKLPIINIAFSLKIIQDPPESLQMFTIIGLFVILTGLGTYRYGSPSDNPVVAPESPKSSKSITSVSALLESDEKL